MKSSSGQASLFRPEAQHLNFKFRRQTVGQTRECSRRFIGRPSWDELVSIKSLGRVGLFERVIRPSLSPGLPERVGAERAAAEIASGDQEQNHRNDVTG